MVRFGQRLYEARRKKGLTVEEVAKATRIRPQFIIAIEKGDYRKLPSTAYAQGFVKNYISFLGLPLREMLALFRREFDEREFITVLPESFTSSREIPLKRIRLQQAVILTVCILFLLFVYIVFQYRYAFLNPTITIQSPREHQVFHSQNITVTGTTQPNNIVVVNNEPAFVDSNGHFKKTLTLFAGSQTITIKAVNTFGKKQIIERHIEMQL